MYSSLPFHSSLSPACPPQLFSHCHSFFISIVSNPSVLLFYHSSSFSLLLFLTLNWWTYFAPFFSLLCPFQRLLPLPSFTSPLSSLLSRVLSRCLSHPLLLFSLPSSTSYPSSALPRLLSAVLRTSEVESRATRASLTTLLSPQMGKDIVWFLRRWAKTYLLVDEKLYQQVGAVGCGDSCSVDEKWMSLIWLSIMHLE